MEKFTGAYFFAKPARTNLREGPKPTVVPNKTPTPTTKPLRSPGAGVSPTGRPLSRPAPEIHPSRKPGAGAFIPKAKKKKAPVEPLAKEPIFYGTVPARRPPTPEVQFRKVDGKLIAITSSGSEQSGAALGGMK